MKVQGGRGILIQQSRVVLTIQKRMCKSQVTEMDDETDRNRFVKVTPIESDQTPGKQGPSLAAFLDSIDLDQLDFEEQHSVWWDDGWETTSTVSIVRRHP